MFQRYCNIVTCYPWRVILVTVCLMLLPIYGAKYTGYSTDYRDFFGGKDVHVSAFDELQATYSKNDNVMLAIEPQDGSVFTREMLAVIEEATALGWKIPFATRVDSITNFQNSYSKNDELIVEPLVRDAHSYSASELDSVRQIATSDPATLNRLVSPQGHVTSINITLKLQQQSINQDMPKVVDAVRELAKKIKADPAVKNVYLSGTVMINNAFLEVTQKDMVTLMPIMFALIVITLIWLTRSISSTIAIFMVVGFSNAVAFGIGGWAGIQLTPPSAAAAPIIMTLSIAGSVHLLITYLKQFHNGNVDRVNKAGAMVHSIQVNFMPITLTCITTVIGFLGMNFADSPPFHDLGNLVATGIVAAYSLTMVFLPSLMMVLPVRSRANKQFGQAAIERLGEFVIHRQSGLLVVMLVVVSLLIMGIPRNQLNDEFVKYFNPTVKFRADNDFITENLTGIYQFEYSINAQGVDDINEYEYLNTLEAFANWFRQQENVWHVQSITDTYKKANKNLHAGEDSHYRIPGDRTAAAQSLLLYEISLPIGLDLNDQINVDRSATKFVVSVYTITSNELVDLENRADQWLRQNAPEYMHAIGTGPAVLFAHIGNGSIRTGLIGGITALFIISVILTIVFRSLKMGVVSLIPNLIPVAMGFGLWGYFHGQINMALATVISMTLGIVVDDTIHFVSKFLRARQSQTNATDAVRHAFAEVGLAMTVTSMVLIAGFMVLTFSPFILNWGMGLLSAITIACALIADFLLLPPILIKLEEASR